MIKRELYLGKIRPFYNKNIIKILVGIRRSGKSVMLEQVKNELCQGDIRNTQCIFINFESAQSKELKSQAEFMKHISEKTAKMKGKIYFFLDEIQELENWQESINSFMVDYDSDIYITGSNAKLLSGELATYLAGRYVEIHLYPFSFKELLEINNIANNKLKENEIFLQYVKYGGMPFLHMLNYEESMSLQYLSDIYSSVVLKDIVQRNSIRDVDLLDRIIKFIVSNIGRTFSAKSISDYFKSENRTVAPETIYNYLKACENAYLFHRVQRQELIGKKILKTQEKFFLSDHGIREAIYGNNQRDIEQVLENIIFMELLRRGYNITIGNISGKEIDFVAEKKGGKAYFQVTYVMANPETREREFAPLLDIKDNFPKYVISMLDEIDMSSEGIIHMNIREFLKN